jgi:uncharacterized protein (DUF885 family)
MEHDLSTIEEIAARLWSYMLETQAYYRLRVGLPVEFLRAESLEDQEADARFGRSMREVLRGLDALAIPSAGRVTYEFLDHACQVLEQAPEYWWTSFAYTPCMAYNLNYINELALTAHVFSTNADVERYLKLVSDYASFIRAQTARTAAQARRGWRIARPALAGVRATLAGIRAAVPGWLLPGPKRLAGLSDGARARFTSTLTLRLGSEVVPALDAALALFDYDYERQAPEGVGITQYPGGDAAYALWTRRHLTLDVSPEDLHAQGVREVESLTVAMSEVRARLAFSGDESQFLVYLKSRGRLYAQSPQQVESRYRLCMDRMRPLVGKYFRRQPAAGYDVKRLDPAAEVGMSYGFYEAPTAANPLGLYRYNGSGLETRMQLTAPSLIYHELVPGHHFHVARQAENEQLPEVRRQSLDISVFNEGWAEYAAGLAGEMGLYDDPHDAYGRLVQERFTAQRLVTDTGLNALGWPLERARAYMARYTLESPTQIGTETLRYSTDIPAQALAYRVGYLKFTELRERARGTLGARFDVRDFHEAILQEGALPLRVLESHLTRWAQQRA